MKYLYVGVGGFLGAVARYWLGILILARVSAQGGNNWITRFPWGTFVINVSGCFLIGLLVTFLDARPGLPTAWRFLFPIGFIGAYTTFSTFELEAYRATAQGHAGGAALYVFSSLLLGYGAVYLGILSGRLVS